MAPSGCTRGSLKWLLLLLLLLLAWVGARNVGRFGVNPNEFDGGQYVILHRNVCLSRGQMGPGRLRRLWTSRAVDPSGPCRA